MNSNGPTGTDLPRHLGSPALRAFTAAGYTHLEDLASADPAELLRLHGVGPRAIRLLRQDLADLGLTLAED